MAETVNDFGAATAYSEHGFRREATKIIRDVTCQALIGTLAGASVAWILAEKPGEIITVGAVVHGTLASGNPTLAFATDVATPLTFADIAGATALTLTASGSAAGSTFSATLGTPFAITANKIVRVTNTANSQANAVTGTVWVTIRSTELLLG